MARRLSTALIGPNTLFREGLKRVLQPTHYPINKVAETIDSVQQTVGLDLIVFIAGADQALLLGQVQRAKEENPSVRVVVMSDIDGSDVVWPLLGAGADGYLLRKISLEALLASLDVVMLGGTVVPPMPRKAFPIEIKRSAGIGEAVGAEVPTLNADPEHKKLSDRETDILLCLMKGESNKLIARKFDIAEATVKVHLKAILRKIRVSNRTQAAVWAHNNPLVCPTRLPQAGLVDFARADTCRGSIARKSYETRHEDRLRQTVVVQEGSLVVADESGVSALSCPQGAARDAV
jgi:two-component system, NarL family, nitrate/nitrite response regulator NarL